MFRFPWGDMHSLNLGWFLQKFNELREDWATAEAGIDGALDAEIQRAEDALSDVFDARDAAAASATSAAGSASSAGTSATAAQNSATAAASSATLANQKATAAGLSEAAAAQSATAASNSATAAATSATQAGNSATNASSSATAAGQSATAAAGSATSAGTSATAAASSATAAAESEENAESAAASVVNSAAQITENKNNITKLTTGFNFNPDHFVFPQFFFIPEDGSFFDTSRLGGGIPQYRKLANNAFEFYGGSGTGHYNFPLNGNNIAYTGTDTQVLAALTADDFKEIPLFKAPLTRDYVYLSIGSLNETDLEQTVGIVIEIYGAVIENGEITSRAKIGSFYPDTNKASLYLIKIADPNASIFQNYTHFAAFARVRRRSAATGTKFALTFETCPYPIELASAILEH